MMKINLKTRIAFVLVVLVALCTAATAVKPDKPLYSNLKVLPKNISSRSLQAIMVDDFQDGLGVTCNFCHARAKNGHGLDFASDARPEKEMARAMMRMTIRVNRKYFKQKQEWGSGLLAVTCNTCHRGEAFPAANAEQK